MKNENFLTAHEISSLLKICYQNTLSFIKYSGIKYIKIGNAYRVKENDFYDFISQHNDINISEFYEE